MAHSVPGFNLAGSRQAVELLASVLLTAGTLAQAEAVEIFREAFAEGEE